MSLFLCWGPLVDVLARSAVGPVECGDCLGDAGHDLAAAPLEAESAHCLFEDLIVGANEIVAHYPFDDAEELRVGVVADGFVWTDG